MIKIAEHKICWLCSHPTSEAYWQKINSVKEYNTQYIRCTNCGLVMVSPYLCDPYLSFETDDSTNYVNNIDLYAPAISNDALRYVINKMETKWFALGNKNKGNLLEVGCAAGYFLFTAQVRDWIVQGIELGRDIAEWGIKYLHVPIYIGSFDEANFEDGFFDVVVAIEVLEHVIAPKAFLQNLYAKLKPGGMLFLTTPNVYSSAYYPPAPNTAILEPTDHLNLFSKNTLSMLLQDFSFNICDIELDGPEDLQLQVLLKNRFPKILHHQLSKIFKLLKHFF